MASSDILDDIIDDMRKAPSYTVKGQARINIDIISDPGNGAFIEKYRNEVVPEAHSVRAMMILRALLNLAIRESIQIGRGLIEEYEKNHEPKGIRWKTFLDTYSENSGFNVSVLRENITIARLWIDYPNIRLLANVRCQSLVENANRLRKRLEKNPAEANLFKKVIVD